MIILTQFIDFAPIYTKYQLKNCKLFTKIIAPTNFYIVQNESGVFRGCKNDLLPFSHFVNVSFTFLYQPKFRATYDSIHVMLLVLYRFQLFIAKT